MISPFVVYDNKGRILRTGTAPKEMLFLQAGEDESVIQGEADDSVQYVKNGAVTPKTPFPGVLSDVVVIADGKDSVILRNIPAETMITVSYSLDSYNVNDGKFELSVDTTGLYTLRCDHPHYLIGEYEVEGISS